MKSFIFLFFLLSLILILPNVLAHCPLCTTGAAVGVGVARAYGVDDSIVGLFLGALIISSALWFNRWLKKKTNFPFQEFLIVIASFLLFVIPFYYSGLITGFAIVKTSPEHHSILGLGIFGIDKLLTGIIIGFLAVWWGFRLSDSIKEKKGKVLWPYQSISFMFIILAILTLIFWLIIK